MIAPAVVLLGVAVACVPALAQQSASPSFGMVSTLSAGGGESSSASFRVISSLDATGVGGETLGATSRLLSGGAVWLVSTPFDDDDGDSVANGEESSVRGGDGNGDSVSDETQASVASLAGVGTPLTAEVLSGDCGAISLADAETAAALGPSARYSFPYGLLRLRLACSGTSGEVTVRLLFHAVPEAAWPPADFRSFGVLAPDFEGQVSYFSLPVEESGIATISGDSVPFIVVRLHDGMFGDQEAADGVIGMTAGPAALSRPVRR